VAGPFASIGERRTQKDWTGFEEASIGEERWPRRTSASDRWDRSSCLMVELLRSLTFLTRKKARESTSFINLGIGNIEVPV
jgi:hypothetical protein